MKIMRVKFENGEVYDIPAEVIAKNRAHSYAEDEGEPDSIAYLIVFDAEVVYTLGNHSELFDWASNNMDWSDVSLHARRVEVARPKPNYEQLWSGCEREIIEAPSPVAK